MFCNDCAWHIEIFYVRTCFGLFTVLIPPFEAPRFLFIFCLVSFVSAWLVVFIALFTKVNFKIGSTAEEFVMLLPVFAAIPSSVRCEGKLCVSARAHDIYATNVQGSCV